MLPLLPRRRGVLFPSAAGPILVGRPTSVAAVDEATRRGYNLAVVTQRDPELTEIDLDDIYPIATEAVIERALRLPDGSTQVWVHGQRRLRIEEIVATEPYYLVRVTPVVENESRPVATEALMRAVLAQFERVVRLSPSLSDEAHVMALNIEKPGWLADFIAASLDLDDNEAQAVLGALDPSERLARVNSILARELDVLELQSQIHTQVQDEVDRSQREYFLREQLKAIQKELGELDPQARDVVALRERIATAGLPAPVLEKAEDELRRLEQLPSMAPESGIIRGYIEWLAALPWQERTTDDTDLQRAAAVLDRNHYGLEQVKERILEYIAVLRLAGDRRRSPTLCFSGPPGVGKTSLGRAIAEALGRKFVRISLGGVRDEAEIRGHRRTYVGAMPGRLIHALRQAGVVNPVVVLDEIDKLGTDFRGDPTAALLEVLDPEQNHAFVDHYLDVPYDLSQVLFITTANRLDTILPALRDRLEVIALPGYSEDEKLQIVRRHLLPRQLAEHGLQEDTLTLSDRAVLKIIREYTDEAGVRGLEREIGRICRKIARRVAEGQTAPARLRAGAVAALLGPQRYFWGVAEERDEVGVATGVAWTEMGGDTLAIEVLLMPGKGDLILTGQLGEVMRESAQAALSYARARARDLGISAPVIDKQDIHLHVPAGGIPKDGPSAGIAIATALISALSGRPVDRSVAMTGEITLRGRVLPVGGIREKVLAAHRAGIATFVLPARNRADLDEVPATVRRALRFVFVNEMSEVLAVAFPGWRPERALALPAAERAEQPARRRPHLPLVEQPPLPPS